MAEPWLSGSITGIHPALASVLYSFEQIKQDLRKWTEDLTDDQIWAAPHGLAPVGFQLRHIAGSIDRLFCYAQGGQLSDKQLAALKVEMTPGPAREQLLAELESTLDRVGRQIRSIDPAALPEPRFVGRQRLPTTLIGLLVHIAEHAQRHVGQAIITCKLLRGPAAL